MREVPLCLNVRNAAAMVYLLGLTVSGAQAQFSFDPAVSYPINERPAAVAPADFDGDGDQDLAITSDNPDKISILLNNGSGTFSPGQVIQTGAGTGADHIVARDVDGDTDVDLIVALRNVSSIRVYLNTGGVLSVGATSAVGVDPRHIESADFNNDTLPDAAVVNRTGDSLSILISAGGAFGPATMMPLGVDPREAASGDWDGDGDRDLAVTSHDDRTIRILTNNGAGGFAQSATLNVNPVTRPDGIDATDLDGDGDIDLAVATGDPDFVSVFRNNAGVFAGPFDFPTGGTDVGSLVAVDLDCDGDMDTAVANRGSSNVSVLANNGAAVLSQPVLLPVGTSPDQVAAADLNDDGSPDLITANRDSNNISIVFNRSCPACTLLGDLNTDGAVNGLDIKNFVTCVIQGGCGPASCGDLNGDSVVDIDDVSPFAALLVGP